MAEINHPGRNQPPDPVSRLAAAALLIALVCGFYWKLVLTNQFTWLSGNDIAFQVLPWMQFSAAEWQKGHFPLWDPNHWGGQPLIGQAQPGVAYPLNWILYSLPLRAGWLKATHLHWYFVIIHLMAAWFAYLLARSLGCRRMASIVGGVSYSLLGWMGATTWPQMLNGAVWAPLVFKYVFQMMRGPEALRPAICGGAALGAAWLSGHHQAPIFISLASGFLLLWAARRNLRLLGWTAAFFAVAMGVGAFQILPAYEYGRLSVRWVGLEHPIGWGTKVPWQILAEYSNKPVNLLGVLFPDLYIHSSLYLGVTVASLAAAAFWLVVRRREVRWLGALGLGAVLFSMAPQTPLHGVLYAVVPLVDKARSPSMAAVLFVLAGAMLAAVGVERISRRAAPKHFVWILLIFAGAVVAVRAGVALAGGFKPLNEDRMVITALAAALLALALRRRRAGTALAVCVAGLVLMEATNENSYFLPSWRETERVAGLKSMSEHGDVAAFLRRSGRWHRVEIDDKLIQYNFGDWHGVPQLGGYLASMSANVQSAGTHSAAGRRLMGAAYRVGDKPTDIHTELVFTSKSGLKVYADPGALARAFAVHQVETRRAGVETWRLIEENQARLREWVFVNGTAPKLETCQAGDTVRIAEYGSQAVTIDAEMGCRGIVVLADTYFPGWQATVDGREAEVLEVDGFIRGVVVEGGRHEVRMEYRPWTALWGAAITGISVLTVLGLGVWARRRKQRRLGETGDIEG